MGHDDRIQFYVDHVGLVWLPLVAERLFAAHVREGRVARGWTQAVLAEELTARGVPLSQSGVAKLERSDDRSRRPIRLNEAAALAALFQQSLKEMTHSRAAQDTDRLLDAKQRQSEAVTTLKRAQRDLALAEQELVEIQTALGSF